MVASKSFSAQGPAIPHKSTGEVADLRGDVELAFLAMEAQVEAPMPAQANIRLNTQPTAADTITIGSDVYEFKAALTDAPTTAGNILVLRGASAAAARTNIVDAINGKGPALSTASAKPVQSIKASIYNTDWLHIEPASFAGGPPVTGPGPSVALSDGLTAAVAWDQTNLNLTGFAGNFKRAVARVVVDATNLATNFDVVLPFVPYRASCVLVTDAAGVPDGTGKAASIVVALEQARSAVTVDLNVGGTDPVATDICYIEVIGL